MEHASEVVRLVVPRWTPRGPPANEQDRLQIAIFLDQGRGDYVENPLSAVSREADTPSARGRLGSEGLGDGASLLVTSARRMPTVQNLVARCGFSGRVVPSGEFSAGLVGPDNAMVPVHHQDGVWGRLEGGLQRR